MRSLKKNLAVLVVMAMLLTAIVPVWAAPASSQQFGFSQEAGKLHDLGLYYGTSATTFVPALQDSLTREAGAILVLRLFGLEDDAKAIDPTDAQQIVSQFKDSGQIDSWAVNQIAYATSTDYAAMIAGNPDGTFNPQGPLKGKDLCTLVLKQLGYDSTAGDFSYDQAVEKIVEISNAAANPNFAAYASNMAVLENKDLTKDDFVGFAYYALLAAPYKQANGDIETPQTIFAKLTSDGKVTQDAVDKTGIANDVAGLTGSSEPAGQSSGAPGQATPVPGASGSQTTQTSATPAPVASSVYAVSATATNGQVAVLLNQAPATAPATTDFTVSQAIGTTAATSVAATVYGFDATTNTAVLTVAPVTAGTVDQSVVYSVAYQTTAPVSAAAFTVSATFNISAVSAISGQEIKLTGTGFTTATIADLLSRFALKNTVTPGTTYAVSAPVLVSTTEVDLTTDTIDNTVSSVTWTYTPATGTALTGTFSPDLTRPTLVSTQAMNATQIALTFSKAMSTTGTLDITNYRIMDVSTGYYRDLTTQSVITLSADQTTVMITLAGTDVSNTTFSPFTVNGLIPKQYIVYITQASSNEVEDLALNTVLQNSSATFTGLATPDTTPPVLTQAYYNTQLCELTLNFNENIKRDPLNVKPTQFTVTGANGNGTVTLTASDFQGLGVDGTQITMDLSTASSQAIAALASPWTITLGAGSIKDTALNLIPQTTMALTVNNPPSITAASYDEETGRLTLDFNKAIEINSTQLNIAVNRYQEQVHHLH